MKKFKFYWLTGQEEVLEGINAADALNRAGYGGGAARALDYFSEHNKYRYTLDDGKIVEGEGFGIKETFLSLGYSEEDYNNVDLQEVI